jgi:cell division protein FtsL
MKIFIYKTLVVTFIIFVLFELTIGYRINQYKNELTSITNKENRDLVISKIKEEIKNANKKENIFDDDEKILLSTFLKKLQKELGL